MTVAGGFSSLITADLWSLTAVCALGAMTPGPSLAVILGVAAERGERAAIIASWAHALGIAGWALFTLYGWGELTRSAPWVARALSWLGALYLIYLAVSLLRTDEHREVINQEISLESMSSESMSLESMSLAPVMLDSEQSSSSQGSSSSQDWGSAALSGFVISASNPKIMVFFIAIYAQILPQTPTLIDRVCASLIPLVIDGAWYTFAALIAARLGVLNWLERHRGGTRVITAGLFVLIALRTLWGVV